MQNILKLIKVVYFVESSRLIAHSSRLFFCILTFNFLTFNYSRAQSNIDVLHYKFEIELSDKSDTIKGKAFVTVQFTEPSSRFELDLTSTNGKGKGMIAYLVNEHNEAISSTHGHDSLLIHLKTMAKKAETRTFEILYQGVPSDGLIISKNPYGDRTFFADNWPNRAHNWIPCKDEPGDKASFEFIVTAPAQYKVVSNGRLEEEKMMNDNTKLTHWIEDVSLSTKVMVIGVAKFAVKQFEDSPPGIPVSAWTYVQDSAIGFQNYAVAPRIIKFYSDYIAPYPYNKLANVQSKTIFGGMENASAIFYFEQSAEQPRSPEDIIAHEIAHQWFGDMASEKSFAHLWLSEGFATYFENTYLGHQYGADSMTKRFMEDREKVIEFAKQSDRPVVDSLSPFMNLLNPNSYQKGGWVLRMLHLQMGDSVFQMFIRTYYDRFKGKNADTDDLEKIAEEVSKKDWKQFFTQWLYKPGIPQLSVQWEYNEKDKTVSVTVNQLQTAGVFQFPLQLAIESQTAKEKLVTLQVSKPSETFSIDGVDEGVTLTIDPLVSLLYDGTIQKINR
ncbi:MAG TPA: M1 family aminopeptidase [Chitinophagaceae bacterium]